MRRITTPSLFLAVAGFALTGCVPIPVVPEESLFSDNRVEFIKTGVTTRQDVVEELGAPTLVRADSQISVYIQARTVAGLVWSVSPEAGGISPIETFSSMIFEHDSDDVVIYTAIIRGKNGCTEDGRFCIDTEFEKQSTQSIFFDFESVLESAMLFTTDKHREKALESDPGLPRCKIFVFSTGKAARIKIHASGLRSTVLNERGYVYWDVPPGTFDLHASSSGRLALAHLNCAAAETSFINIHASRSRKEPLTISVNEASEGERAINARMRVLD